MIEYSPEFIEYLKTQENAPLAKKGVNMRHESPEGGRDTVGYGHKLTEEEERSGKVYGIPIASMTPEQAEKIMFLDLKRKEQELARSLGKRFLTLPNKNKEMLLDFAYNLGTSKTLEEFPNFTSAVLSNNMDEAKKEYIRYFSPKGSQEKKPLARNKYFKELFFDVPTNENIQDIIETNNDIYVERGDTLYSLAKDAGVPVERLMKINGITDPTKLMVGQRLKVK